MRPSSWEDCIHQTISRRVTPDAQKASSLLETARARVAFVTAAPLTQDNASFVFEGYYTSLLETVHALVVAKGFNVANHLCLGYYLRDVLHRDDLFRAFDDGRYKRNALVYYGKRLNLEVARATVHSLKAVMDVLVPMTEKALGP